MSRKHDGSVGPFDRFIHFVALGFGAGAAPVAPGTFGTLMGVPIYLALRELAWPGYVLAVVLMFGVGVWVCGQTERALGQHDHPAIVWDEITAFQITMFAAPAGPLWIAVGFFLFRLFDVWKPWPIRQLEQRIKGGLGTMLDDVLAGLFALLILQGTYLLLPAHQ